MNVTPSEMATLIGSSLLSFPVTHFDAGLQFDEAAYRGRSAGPVRPPLTDLAGGETETLRQLFAAVR